MPTYSEMGEAVATILVVVAAHLRQGIHTSRRTARLEARVRRLSARLEECLRDRSPGDHRR